MDAQDVFVSSTAAPRRPHQSVEAMISDQFVRGLTTQLQDRKDIVLRNDVILPPESMGSIRTPTKSPSKSRSLSDSIPKLSPSPKFREQPRKTQDDHSISIGPKTPRRPDALTRGLSLQMPPRDNGMPSPATLTKRAPLSPQLDSRNTYGSPTSLLPRRSRGAEFSRACTNLHHSTLAEQSSPDSSPTITQKGMAIPSRRSMSMNLDYHHANAMNAWSTGVNGDRTAASSLGSMSVINSDSSSGDSDGDDPMDPDDNDDPMFMTPHATKSNNILGTPISGTVNPSLGGWPSNFSTAMPNFMTLHRARLRKGRSRKSSSSASGHSSIASPGTASPPYGRSVDLGNGGYFAREGLSKKAPSRRESLSLHTNDLHISSGNDSGDEAVLPHAITPGVIRRPVTRRGNLLPKSRQFGRIKAELQEEHAPVDSEFRREAEIIKQVRESDASYDRYQSSTAQSSPSLLPSNGPGVDGLDDVTEDLGLGLGNSSGAGTKGLFGTFHMPAPINKLFGGKAPLGIVDIQARTPPLLPRAGSSVISDDVNMDSPTTVSTSSASNGTLPAFDHRRDPDRSRATTPLVPPTAAEGLKKSNKRRRDDDLDVASFKRRAVSPSISVQNSPVLSQSPSQKDGAPWSNPKSSKENQASGHANGERANSAGSSTNVPPSLGPKRIGLQGMTDTNDGLMKMSIE